MAAPVLISSSSSQQSDTITNTNPSIIKITNSFADETRFDSSSKCINARINISQWNNVTQCYGPYLSLYYATPKQVCQGNCLTVTIQAAKYIDNACRQTPVESGFTQSDIYEIWSNELGATSACTVVPSSSSSTSSLASSASLNSDPTTTDSTTDASMKSPPVHSYNNLSSSPNNDSSTAASAAAAVPASSTDNTTTELNPPTYYRIQAVFDLYMKWKSVMSSLDSSTTTTTISSLPIPTSISNHNNNINIKSSNQLFLLSTEQRLSLISTQCVDINRQFWSLYVYQPGRQPSLYYWTILEPKEYIHALQELCGPKFFIP